jgi:UDP-galactopyranose mutase
MKLELLKRMKLKYSKLFQESLQYELIAIKKCCDLFISYTSFSSVQNDLYTGTIQKLYNYTEH